MIVDLLLLKSDTTWQDKSFITSEIKRLLADGLIEPRTRHGDLNR